MAGKNANLDYIVDQASAAGSVRARAMFGGVAVYCDEKVVALFGDDRLYLKPTDTNRPLLPDAEEGAPYPGAKPCLVVPEEIWDDPERLSRLFAETARALPTPKPKKPRKPKL